MVGFLSYLQFNIFRFHNFIWLSNFWDDLLTHINLGYDQWITNLVVYINVYVVGEEDILKELKLAGIQYLGGPEDGEKKIELKPGYMMEHVENVGAVVVGFDRYFNYYKIQYATLCICENPGCLFIATNHDAVTQLTDAQEWAGSGSMVGAVGGSTQREPLVVGKPSTFMMDYLADKFGITKSQICMVGDRLDTDILFG